MLRVYIKRNSVSVFGTFLLLLGQNIQHPKLKKGRLEVSVHNQVAPKQDGTAQEQAEDSKSNKGKGGAKLFSFLIMYAGCLP